MQIVAYEVIMPRNTNSLILNRLDHLSIVILQVQRRL